MANVNGLDGAAMDCSSRVRENRSESGVEVALAA